MRHSPSTRDRLLSATNCPLLGSSFGLTHCRVAGAYPPLAVSGLCRNGQWPVAEGAPGRAGHAAFAGEGNGRAVVVVAGNYASYFPSVWHRYFTMGSRRLFILLGAVATFTGLYAQQQVAYDLPMAATPVFRTTGGSWLVERSNATSPTSRYIVTNAELHPVSAFELISGNDLSAGNIRSFAMPNGNVLSVMDEMRMVGTENFFIVKLVMLNSNGTVLWQRGFGRNEGDGLPASTCGLCTSIEVDDAGRIFLMIPRFMLIEDLLCIDGAVGGLVWWKHRVNGTSSVSNSITPDEDGGCYWWQGPTKLVHINAAGEVVWAKELTWPGMGISAMGGAIERLVNGHIRFHRGTDQHALFVADIDANGTLLWARSYSPFFNPDYVEAVPQENGGMLIGGMNGTFMHTDEDGGIIASYQLAPGAAIVDLATAGEHLLAKGADSETAFLFELGASMDTACSVLPAAITSFGIPLNSMTFTDIPFYTEDVVALNEPVAYSTSPITLPLTSAYCDDVGMDRTSSIPWSIRPTLVSCGENIIVQCGTAGTLDLLSGDGKRLGPSMELRKGNNTLSTRALLPGLYLVRIHGEQAGSTHTERIVVE